MTVASAFFVYSPAIINLTCQRIAFGMLNYALVVSNLNPDPLAPPPVAEELAELA